MFYVALEQQDYRREYERVCVSASRLSWRRDVGGCVGDDFSFTTWKCLLGNHFPPFGASLQLKRSSSCYSCLFMRPGSVCVAIMRNASSNGNSSEIKGNLEWSRLEIANACP